MAMIEVTETGPGAFRVEVREGDGSTTHEVTVPDGYPEQVGAGSVDPAALVEESFRFLLEREPKESILGRFDLPTIQRYFPDYERIIGGRVNG